MYPVLFKIGGLTVYTHGVMAVLGIVAGSFLLYRLARKSGLETQFLFDNIVYSVLLGIIGARLTYFFLYRDQFSSAWEILQLWQGGLVSYGGFILGGLTFLALLSIQKKPKWRWFDIIAIAFSGGLVLGRAGDLMAGEYAGIPSKSSLAISGVIPVAMYEAILSFLIFTILLFLYGKSKRHPSGMIFSYYLCLYGGGRFLLDFWRAESDLLGPVSIGQITSLIIALLGLLLIVILRKRRERYENVSGNA